MENSDTEASGGQGPRYLQRSVLPLDRACQENVENVFDFFIMKMNEMQSLERTKSRISWSCARLTILLGILSVEGTNQLFLD